MTQKNSNISLDQLFEDAEPRLKMAADKEHELYQSLKSEWQDVVVTRKRRRWGVLGAGLAASITAVMLVASFINTQQPTQPSVAVVKIEAVFGQSITLNNEPFDSDVDISRVFFTNQVIETGSSSRIALDVIGGGKIRLDQNSKLQFDAKSTVTLVHGRLYYDSNDRSPAILSSLYKKNQIVINTSRGAVQNLGTQFSITDNNAQLLIAVRSGEVSISQDTDLTTIETGQQLTINDKAGYQWSTIAAYGSEWTWAEQTLPAFDLNNATLALLLEWVAHETGRQVVFDSEEAKQLAQTAVLVGTVNKQPLDALSLWLETVDLEADIKQEIILIRINR